MSDIFKININQPINYSVGTVYISCTGQTFEKTLPLININDIQDKYDNRFKKQPPNTGA